VSRGHDVTVFSPKSELTDKNKMLNGVKYVFIDCEYYYYLLEFINKKSWVKKSYKVFREHHAKKPFNLVISQSSSAEGIIKNKNKNKLGIKVISIAHGTILSELKTYLKSVSSYKDAYRLMRNLQYFVRQFFGRQRLFVLNSNKVIAVSSSVKKSLIEETYVHKDKVVVIHNGIESKKLVGKRRNKKEDTHLVYVGRMEQEKGVFELLKMMEGLKKGVILNMVGDGPSQDALRGYAEVKGIENRVVFHGRVSQEEVLKILSESDIFVFFSQRIEGFPMTIPEAMFLGLPTVVSDIGGNSDAVVNGKTGYLVDPKNFDDFVSKVNKLIWDSDLRKEMGRGAKIRAVNNFSVDIMIDKYEKVFKEVVK